VAVGGCSFLSSPGTFSATAPLGIASAGQITDFGIFVYCYLCVTIWALPGDTYPNLRFRP